MKINNIQVNNKQQVDNFYFPSNLEGAWLENVIKEIWEDKEYEKFDTKINPGDIVLDLGANVGVFTAYALNQGAHHIYAFECETKYFDCLRLNTINFSQVTNIEGIISERYDDVWELDPFRGKDNYNFSRIFKKFNLGKIDFCKIDIEGGEYPLLLDSNIDDIKKINKFSIEVHNINVDHKKVYNIIEMFSKNGYFVNFSQNIQYELGMIYAKKKDI